MESIFSKRLKEERINKKITQQQLANLINNGDIEVNISRNSITRYENGTRTPDYNTLLAISDALGVDIDYLLGKSNKKYVEISSSQLDAFIKLVNKILSEDEVDNNYALASIIGLISKLIDKSYKDNCLVSLEKLISSLTLTVEYGDKSSILDNIEDLNSKILNN